MRSLLNKQCLLNQFQQEAGHSRVIFNGILAGDSSGRAFASGDFNDDGIDDLIIGAPYASSKFTYFGQCYVVFGRTTGFPPVFELASLLPENGGDGSQGFVIDGTDGGNLTCRMAAAGDINMDGMEDIIIGAHCAGPGQECTGEVYIIYGRTTGFPPVFELTSLKPENGGDGTAGVIFEAIAEGDRLGFWVHSADVNDDGAEDLILGARSADPNGADKAGVTYVIYGGPVAFPAIFEIAKLLPINGGDGSEGVIINGITAGDFSGRSVGAGDINGDGIADVIIGARAADPHQQWSAGETYVVFGRANGFPAVLELTDLQPQNGGDGSMGVIINGIDRADQSGRIVKSGDINGDGIDDLMIAAQVADPNGVFGAGETYVIFGRTDGYPAIFEIADLLPENGGDGSEGIAFYGHNEGDTSSRVIDSGDINGDGLDDLVIGAFRADPGGVNSAGETYVFYGRTTGFPAVFELANLKPENGGDGSEGIVLTGNRAQDQLGFGVSAGGDINGDGILDIVAGAAGGGPAGQSFLIFGR